MSKGVSASQTALSSLRDQAPTGLAPDGLQSADALRELAERCEKATGPDRELDEAIMASIFVRDERHIGGFEGWADEPDEDYLPVKDRVWVDPTTDKWVSTHAHEFTGSIDRALKLLSGVCVLITLSEIKGDGMPMCVVGNPEDASLYEAVADTMPLAMCAAALRARSATA